jgi:hypothetical protein
MPRRAQHWCLQRQHLLPAGKRVLSGLPIPCCVVDCWDVLQCMIYLFELSCVAWNGASHSLTLLPVFPTSHSFQRSCVPGVSGASNGRRCRPVLCIHTSCLGLGAQTGFRLMGQGSRLNGSWLMSVSGCARCESSRCTAASNRKCCVPTWGEMGGKDISCLVLGTATYIDCQAASQTFVVPHTC